MSFPTSLSAGWPLWVGLLLFVAVAWVLAQQMRRRAASLRDSEERWKFALDGSGDGVWDADLATGRTLYSPRWKTMLGHTEAEIGTAYEEWSSRIHPDDLARVMALEQQCHDGQSDHFIAEYRLRTKLGRWLWMLDRGKVVRRSASGRALRMIGTHTDISARKTAEARQGAYAAAMTLIATAAPLPDILQTIVRGVEVRSDWLCSILLLEADGVHISVGAAPSLPEFFNQGLAGLAIGPQAGSCGTAMYHGERVIAEDIETDPRWAPYLALARQAGLRACWSEPILGRDGVVLGSFAAYHREPRTPSTDDLSDIGEAAQLAAVAIERRRSDLSLRDSEERLQRALDASRLALWDLDLDTGAVFLSDAWAEMLEGQRQPTHTSFEALTALVPDEDQTRIAGAMMDTLRGLTPSYTVEHRVRRPDGQLLWVRSQGRVIERNAQGRALRAVGTNRNITARKESEALRHTLEAQLREAQKLEAIGILAGGIAHDFNNIMAAILGNVALARQDVGEGHPALASLVQIHKAGLRARNLVQQILAFSRRQPEAFVRQALRPLVEETVAMLRSMAGHGVTISAQLCNQPVDALANPTQLQQVLMNLGTNAWQAMHHDRGHIEIGLAEVHFADDGRPRPGTLPHGGYVHLWVKDDGCGMDEATRQHIFEPFFTTKPVGQGTGLGLAVAHGIVEAHHGAITVTTAPGQGSRFDVYLPLVEHESLPMPLDALPPQPLGQGQHVLYVDDDEVMVEMVQRLLEHLGYRATCVLDAREAIAMVEREPARFDVVVTDYNMPHCTGLDLARALAPLRPDLPVAISTGYLSDELRAGAAELGVRGLMQKEHTFEELGALVQGALR
ncbi:MAG: PAS domain-containing protein [Burkholderiales bacterium]|nr:PAS domain-containing protein [Burkholderiales bacterium]MBP6674426.1 PAS domain-containing protein [Vitreoscilla sp.]